ncbi:thioredoxin family protein [Candidatus Heimdallarchaeota archaeon B3_Heim]|nr:MAG: thioredoxin family protein [Candidatus Heimdallarchaeota archaeon B3_Heim]
MTRTIEILRGGCSKCEALTKSAKSVVVKLGWKANIVHITDMDEIVERGIFTTPALALDDEIIVSARYLPPNQLETLFLKYPTKE